MIQGFTIHLTDSKGKEAGTQKGTGFFVFADPGW